MTAVRSTCRTWASSRSPGTAPARYLQARLSNDLDRIGAGQAQYTLLTNESGGIVDDLIVYRLDDDRLLPRRERSQRRGRLPVDHDALAETDVRDVSSE